MISMTFTGPLLQRKLSFFTIHDRAKIRRVDSEEFRFVSRTGPSVWWQADCARRAGRRGEAGVGFRHHVGRAVLDPRPPCPALFVIAPPSNPPALLPRPL